ncbi:STAS domain-containing protein [Mycolicibacterium sp. CH28]|uniref:STAS domain-containing protein n=1 Tax=Mycolicibacterium sp. CH28 TaxID=2512237 RepID=UPI0010810052|nr:STAS domain-containing protein [Mycolicibacterium sp. CH28]TGD84948.1 STAS domain-containing protein [Mycolicibacterium sp. CH28]
MTISTVRCAHSANVACGWLTSSVAGVSVYGDVDASNADVLSEHSCAHVMRCHGLIVDLRGVDFFGSAGLLALEVVSDRCERAGIGWAMVPGPAVSRLLRICDARDSLPAARTVDAALATILGLSQLDGAVRSALS